MAVSGLWDPRDPSRRRQVCSPRLLGRDRAAAPLAATWARRPSASATRRAAVFGQRPTHGRRPARGRAACTWVATLGDGGPPAALLAGAMLADLALRRGRPSGPQLRPAPCTRAPARFCAHGGLGSGTGSPRDPSRRRHACFPRLLGRGRAAAPLAAPWACRPSASANRRAAAFGQRPTHGRRPARGRAA